MVKLKRSYDSPSKSDGYRVLVDRLWPRGVKKADLSLDEWAKELAPSAELRKSFDHDPDRWPDFQKHYRAELKHEEAAAKLRELARLAREGTLTLVYSAKDEEHNNAVVLKKLIEARVKKAA